MPQIKKPNDINTYIQSPTGSVVLIYGPDSGLVRERADALCTAVVGDSGDPFATVTLDGDTIADSPDGLFTEASALSLFGGKRAIRVNGLADKALDTIKSLFTTIESTGIPNMVVLVAGDLPAKSKIRTLFDKSPNHKSIACYNDDGRDVGKMLNERLNADNITLQPDAQKWILSHLGADRGNTRNEIEKLALYAGQGGTIDLPTAMKMVGDNQALNLSEMVYMAFDGNHGGIDTHYDALIADGTAPIAIMRAITGHIAKLQLIIATAGQEKRSVSQVIGGLQPPVFWKLKPRLETHATRWHAQTLADMLTLCLQTEQNSKQTDYPVETMTNRLLHQIALRAK